jgi:hypothetical protein
VGSRRNSLVTNSGEDYLAPILKDSVVSFSVALKKQSESLWDLVRAHEDKTE